MWFLSTRPVESQGVGRTQSTLWDQTLSALTHSGCCHWILISETKTNPPSLGNLQKWDCFVRYGTRGISTDCASKNSSVAEGLPAPVSKPAHPWQAFGCISNGYCFRAATDQDRQTVFPLGLAPVRFSPLQSVFAESYLQCQGKNNFKKKNNTTNLSQLTHWTTWKAIWKLFSGLLMLHWVYLFFHFSSWFFIWKSPKWSEAITQVWLFLLVQLLARGLSA